MKDIGEVMLRLEIERYKNSIENITVSVILLSPFVLGLLFISINDSPMKNLNLEHFDKDLSKIYYSDLNVSEIEIAESLVNELKTEYYNLARNITFSKNQSFIKSKSNYEGVGDVVGVNLNNGGNVYVLYRNNIIKRTKIILCHELLHGLFFMEGESEEWFINDINKYDVCYQKDSVLELT